MSHRLSIIIVTWNVAEHLRRCLQSIQQSASRSSDFEIWVVDNASTDETVEIVCREFPAVQVVANRVNLGFGCANNQALRCTGATDVLLLNPDTEVAPTAIEEMLSYLGRHPEVGVVGPQLRFADGSVQSSRRRFPTLRTALVESTILQRYWPNSPALRRFYVKDHADDETQEVDWLVGACLLVRRAALDSAGLFDERFFMYSEELDLCRRIRLAGWRVVYLPRAIVFHHEGRSSEQNILGRQINFHESKSRYFEKYHGWLVGKFLRLFIIGVFAVQWWEEAFKLVLGHKPPLRRDRLRMISGVLRWQIAHFWPSMR